MFSKVVESTRYGFAPVVWSPVSRNQLTLVLTTRMAMGITLGKRVRYFQTVVILSIPPRPLTITTTPISKRICYCFPKLPKLTDKPGLILGLLLLAGLILRLGLLWASKPHGCPTNLIRVPFLAGPNTRPDNILVGPFFSQDVCNPIYFYEPSPVFPSLTGFYEYFTFRW